MILSQNPNQFFENILSKCRKLHNTKIRVYEEFRDNWDKLAQVRLYLALEAVTLEAVGYRKPEEPSARRA